jgi:hypothetical protein
VGKDGRRYVVCSMWGKNKIQDSEEQVPGVRFQVPGAQRGFRIRESEEQVSGVGFQVSDDRGSIGLRYLVNFKNEGTTRECL